MSTFRYSATGFSIDNKGYVCAGYDVQNQILNDLWEWHQFSNVWSQMASISLARMAPISFVIDSFAYVGLGYISNLWRNDLQQNDPVTNTWISIPNLPAQGRYGNTSVIASGMGYVVCGNLGSGTVPFSNQLWEFNPLSNSWSLKSPFPGASRYGCKGRAIGNYGYAFGGGNSSSMTNDFWQYDVRIDTWQQKTNFPESGKSYTSIFVIDGKLVVRNGKNATGFFREFYDFDFNSNIWSFLPPMPLNKERWATACFTIENKGYVAS